MVNIRKLEEKDIKSVVLLEEKILHETLGYDMIKSELNNPVVYFYVLEIDELICGYIGCYSYLNEVEILNFVVDESFQNQGFGSKLLNHIMDCLKPNVITLEVRASNMKAQSFYKKHGFLQISIRKSYYSNKEDALVLKKELL